MPHKVNFANVALTYDSRAPRLQRPHLNVSIPASSIYLIPHDEMSTTQWQTKVVPAQLSFLAIYNPSLGLTDETFRDQLVFYYSRAALEARIAAKKTARKDGAGGDALRQEENEKLRQIGLAQGMVDFARLVIPHRSISYHWRTCG
jgi:hypothetical protein